MIDVLVSPHLMLLLIIGGLEIQLYGILSPFNLDTWIVYGRYCERWVGLVLDERLGHGGTSGSRVIAMREKG